MKKVISVVLALIMLMSVCSAGVSAVGDIGVDNGSIKVHTSRSQIPVIRILGDGEPLYDKDQNKLFHIRSFYIPQDEDEEDGSVTESLANILFPFLVDGLLTDNWEPYYENLQKEISELVGDARLDENGNPVNGTGISDARKKEMEDDLSKDLKEGKGYYEVNDYRFWYDWRLDPLYTADLLHEHIQKVKAATNCPKVSIMASCLGTLVTTAYITKYGTADLHGVGFTGSVSGGAEALSEAISGKFNIDGAAINRMLIDSDYIGEFNVDELITTSIDLLTAAGIIDGAEQAIRETLYAKLVEGVTSALALSTFFTWPTYWAAVTADDYDDAIKYVFGPEGSEKRTTYAGLIEKIENYNTVVRKNYTQTIKSIGENGVNFGAVAKYGFQILPICESNNAVSDQFVSLKRSSFGATTSTIDTTLSDEYIEARIAEDPDNAAYISPDKKVDVSTCLYPESTWIMKNVSHSEYTVFERRLLYDVITADHQIVCGDEVNGVTYSRFLVYDYETDIMATMTEDNCNTEHWEVNKDNENLSPKHNKIFNFVRTVIKFFVLVAQKLSKLFA